MNSNPRRSGQSTDFICNTCKESVAYFRGAHSGVWCHTSTGYPNCAAPFTGEPGAPGYNADPVRPVVKGQQS